ncbi:uncharacterized protein DS421_17g588430 [Arachis hypogaea]|nr:uncharacterized protein DS421_17g588430 [Arachis hypogaea]
MTLSRGGHLKASRNGLIFGRLLCFFLWFFLRRADPRSLNDTISRRTPKLEPNGLIFGRLLRFFFTSCRPSFFK